MELFPNDLSKGTNCRGPLAGGKNESAGNRTLTNCLEGNYANHYTTDPCACERANITYKNPVSFPYSPPRLPTFPLLSLLAPLPGGKQPPLSGLPGTDQVHAQRYSECDAASNSHDTPGLGDFPSLLKHCAVA